MNSDSGRTVFVSGFFNVLHPGHLRLLKFASNLGERLVVGVLSDSFSTIDASVREASRLEAISSLRMVDHSFIIRDSVASAILKVRPDIVVKGREHLSHDNEELSAVASYGGKLLFSSGDSFFSSTDLIANEVDTKSRDTIEMPSDYMNLHGITASRLNELLDCIAEVRVLVVGDAIVDEYVTCRPIGMSREDPTLVVAPVETRLHVGGAAIVAAHAASVGRRSSLHTVIGPDSEGSFLAEQLRLDGVEARLHVDESRPTTRKQRWRASGKTLLRVNHFHQDPIAASLQESLFAGVADSMRDHDVLIFADFNYGVLPQSLVDQLTGLGSSLGLTMAADSQTSSQMGDVSRFIGMHLITPTEYEARVAVRNFSDGLVVLADEVRQKARARIVLLTLEEDGVLLRGCEDSLSEPVTGRIPALNSRPLDVAGAGDAMLLLASMSLACGASMHEAALLGSMAAAVQVSTNGNSPLSSASLYELIAT